MLAAKRLFATHGFNETTTLTIARAADVSHAFLLNQFPNKDQLLIEVLDAGWSPITKRIRGLCRIQTPQRRLTRALELLLHSWLQDPEAAELMLLEGRRVREGGLTTATSSGFANCLGIFDHYVADVVLLEIGPTRSVMPRLGQPFWRLSRDYSSTVDYTFGSVSRFQLQPTKRKN